MKKVFLLALILSTSILPQWTQHLPNPYGKTLFDIELIGAEDIFIAGFGAFIKSTDNGNNWTTKRNVTQYSDLWHSLYFANNSVGWMSGNGKIIKTTNGGGDWVDQNPNSSDQIYNIRFFDTQNGVAITGQEKRVLTTTNGGNDWVVKNVPSTNFLQCGYFVNSQTGWVTGQNEILKTSDAGTTWTNYPITSWFFDSYFINENIGWFVGSGGQITKTTDAGLTWNNQNSNTTKELYSICMYDEDLGWISGRDGVVLKTEDGGKNWTTIQTQTMAMLYSIKFISQNNGWAVGDSGVVLKTTDGGVNWLLKSKNLNSHLTNGFFINSQTGWLTGSNGLIFKTSDSGDNWLVTVAPVLTTFYDIEFANIYLGWAVGNNGNIMKSTDGGLNWNTQVSGVTTRLNSISSTGTDTVFAVGHSGTILKTIDGGNIWTNIIQTTSNQFTKIIKDDNNDLWICGYDNSSFTPLLLKSENAGINWSNKFFTDSVALYALAKAENDFIIGGGKSITGGTEIVIFRSTNDGEYWSKIFDIPGIPNGSRIVDLKINKEGNYTAITTKKIFYSSDGGNNWSEEALALENLNSVFPSDSTTYWVTGDNSLLLENSNSGITNIQGFHPSSPNNFSLSQNYPNPFNPSTKISYSLAATGIVSLKVYDILGREIATLVNEEKPAGKYEVSFNASSLASGVYFYQIKVNSTSTSLPAGRQGSGQGFIQTKKLMLLK